MLSEIVPSDGSQADLFLNPISGRSGRFMAVRDEVNHKMGRQTLKVASEGYCQPWKMKQGNKSPVYTTQWAGIPVAT